MDKQSKEMPARRVLKSKKTSPAEVNGMPIVSGVPKARRVLVSRAPRPPPIGTMPFKGGPQKEEIPDREQEGVKEVKAVSGEKRLMSEIKQGVAEVLAMAKSGASSSDVNKRWNTIVSPKLNLYGGEYLPYGAASEMSDDLYAEIQEALEANKKKGKEDDDRKFMEDRDRYAKEYAERKLKEEADRYEKAVSSVITSASTKEQITDSILAILKKHKLSVKLGGRSKTELLDFYKTVKEKYA
jgi:DNA-directed RNA polymerase beta subunit